MNTGVIIVGNGIAGLSTALFLAEFNPDLSVILLDKSMEEECSTKYAQGGMAAVMDTKDDSFSSHIQDTCQAGQNLSECSIVRQVVRKAPEAIHDLEQWGIDFDKNLDGAFALGLEGGHSHYRIVHRKDHTGREIHNKLLAKLADFPQIQRITHTASIDLLCLYWKGKKYCRGVKVLDWPNHHIYSIYAKFVVLVTGGSGQLFLHTTNPNIATGDGLAMAIRAGAAVQGLSYVQFHPTAIYDERCSTSLLITEAIRGAGAYIVNHKQERFLFQGTPKGELDTRDVVSRLIFQELRESKKSCVFLDARHLGKEYLRLHFPQVFGNCSYYGYDLSRDLIPIAPAAHYQCGGIRVDVKGRSSLGNLYAVGECASTGLHGANRLASNSLTEATVFAKIIAKNISERWQKPTPSFGSGAEEIPLYQPSNKSISDEARPDILFTLKSYMTKALTAPKDGPHNFDNELEFIQNHKQNIHIPSEEKLNLELVELNNLLAVGEALLQCIRQEEDFKFSRDFQNG